MESSIALQEYSKFETNFRKKMFQGSTYNFKNDIKVQDFYNLPIFTEMENCKFENP